MRVLRFAYCMGFCSLFCWLVLQYRSNKGLRNENLRIREEVGNFATIQEQNFELNNEVAQLMTSQPPREESSRELLRLRGEIGVLRSLLAEGSKTRGDTNSTIPAIANEVPGTNAPPGFGKIPLLGDIPILGAMFRAESAGNGVTGPEGQ